MPNGKLNVFLSGTLFKTFQYFTTFIRKTIMKISRQKIKKKLTSLYSTGV